MTFNVDAFIRDGCAYAEIPETHVGAVLARAHAALAAIEARPRPKTREQRISSTPRAICVRVLAQAVADYEAGTLERRV